MTEKTRQYEEEKLAATKAVLSDKLAALKTRLETKQQDILGQQGDIDGETSRSIGSLWNAESFEQLVELSQYTTMIADDIDNFRNMEARAEQLEKQLLSPYFARIDFVFEGEGEAEEIYIGRFSLMDHYQMVIYDWRSPVAGVFYRYGLGAASYQAPQGEIQGEITLKRQYEINDGELEYFFDTDIEIVDDILKTALSQNASPQMKSIVETIQMDQDAVIRDRGHDVLMVQGAAGSGKTSIALHRVAYLMYRGLTDRLSSEQIVILSPHRLFEQYIAGVLPELGEESARSYLFDELIDETLEEMAFQGRSAWVEALVAGNNPWAQDMVDCLAFKTSAEFMKMLEALAPRAEDMETLRQAYEHLFADRQAFFALAEAAQVSLPQNIETIFDFTAENLTSATLFYDDALALTYLALNHFDKPGYRHIKQLIIDEVQDYYPLHFEILKRLFPVARFTLLGDVNQAIEKQVGADFYDMVAGILSKGNENRITLTKSFRSTQEIVDFSRRFTRAETEAFPRHGDPVEIVELTEKQDVTPLLEAIAACQSKGYETIGIICKSLRDGRLLHRELPAELKVNLVKENVTGDLSGVSVLPVYYSKGLEFDAVFIWDADGDHYHTDYDKNLLYIACTRALHHLEIFYHGSASPLLAE